MRRFGDAGFQCREPVTRKHTDYYYTDTEGLFDREEVLLRFRDEGTNAFITMKMPSLRNGLGLSRREIEDGFFNDSRFDRWKAVQEYAREHYRDVEIRREPRLKVEVIRCGCRIASAKNFYEFSFDKLVYVDPSTGTRSVPCYELEFELLNEAIRDDLQMAKVLSVLTGKYLFEEETVSKYARGMAFLGSIKR